MQRDNLVAMGHAGKAHGIRGELAITWRGEFVPEKGMTLYFQKGDAEPVPHDIRGVRWNRGKLLVFLDEVSDRTKAERLAGSIVLVPKETLPALEDGEYYLEELLKCDVYLPDGQYVGRLEHVEFPAEQEIWVIIQSTGKELLFPAREEFIEKLDPHNHKIIINPPDGLLEIYNA